MDFNLPLDEPICRSESNKTDMEQQILVPNRKRKAIEAVYIVTSLFNLYAE